MCVLLLSTFFLMRKLRHSMRKLSNLPEVSQPINNEAMFQSHKIQLQNPGTDEVSFIVWLMASDKYLLVN